MKAEFYRIKLKGDMALIKRAKKLVNVGLDRNSGVALYKTISLKTKDEVVAYLNDFNIEFDSVSKMVSK